MQRMTLDTYEPAPNLIGEFGPPKVGKTENMATLALVKPVPYLPIWLHDWDQGSEPFIRKLKLLEQQKKIAPLKNDDVVVFRYNPKGGARVGEGLHPGHQGGKNAWLDFLVNFNSLYDYVDPQNPHQFKTATTRDGLRLPRLVAIDSMSTLQDQLLDFVLAMRGVELGDAKVHGGELYGKQMAKVQELLDSARALPTTFLFIFHEKLLDLQVRVQGDDARSLGETIRGMAVTGQMMHTISKDFGTVLYAVKNGDKYQWQTRSGPNYVRTVGTRTREELPPLIDQDFSLVL